MTGGAGETTGRTVPPAGEVTFLFTDVEGSTVLWENDADAMTEALAEHDKRMRGAIARHGGYVFTTAGDSFAVAFASASEAVAATVDAQRSLAEPCGTIALRVRMGLHTGVASIRDGDYFGSVVNRCAPGEGRCSGSHQPGCAAPVPRASRTPGIRQGALRITGIYHQAP